MEKVILRIFDNNGDGFIGVLDTLLFEKYEDEIYKCMSDFISNGDYVAEYEVDLLNEKTYNNYFNKLGLFYHNEMLEALGFIKNENIQKELITNLKLNVEEKPL